MNKTVLSVVLAALIVPNGQATLAKPYRATTKLDHSSTVAIERIRNARASAAVKYDWRNGVYDELPVQDALHFGYSAGWCGYHSGYGGLYGDGLYPGGVCKDGGSHLID